MITLNHHDVAKITISKVSDGLANRKFRTITITNNNGEELKITCFADNSKNLIIKKSE